MFAASIKKYWSFIVSIMLILALVGGYWIFPEYQQFLDEGWEIIWSEDEDRITAWFKEFGIWGPLVIIGIMVLQMFLVFFPTWLPIIVAVLGYGPFWGVVLSIVAVAIASTIAYFIGKGLGIQAKKRFVGEKTYRKVKKFMDQYGFGAVVLFRISPFLSNDGISFIAGITGMKYRRFMIATFAGILPLAGAIAYFGRETETLKTGLYWIGGAGALLYIGYILLDQRLRK